jgi:drug/metabolite transporter (DMT)-like permease
MPALALIYALMSAVTSAIWNMLLKGARDTEAASAVGLAMGAIAFSPTLAFAHFHRAVWPYLALSAGLELAYFILLATAYRVAEMSLVFPLARGLAPFNVLIFGLVVLGDRVTAGEVIGVLVLASGAVAVRGIRAVGRAADVGLAVLISFCVAGYTLVDKHGVTLASPAAYFELIVIAISVPYLLLVGQTKGVGALRAEIGLRAGAIGIGVIGGYDLILEALRLAAAAPVAAVRESSVVIGTGLAAVVLHERVGRARWIGVALVTTGVVVLALYAP